MNYSSFSEDTGHQTENFDLNFDSAEMRIAGQTIRLNKVAG